MSDLKLALLQESLIWENPEAGLAHIQKYFQDVPDADIYILPEMFTTGFSMSPEKLAETMDGSTVNWMKSWSVQTQKYLVGSIILSENGNYFNRLIVSGPNGIEGWYDKKHLFRMAGEDQHYSAGREKLILNILGWNISFWICYDLRFPVWMRNINLEYDLGIIIANWPERRSTHWEKLLPARAIENQTYIAAVNRIGKDGNGLNYSGKSVVLNPEGEYLTGNHSEGGWLTATISKESLVQYRNKFEAWKDADKFTWS